MTHIQHYPIATGSENICQQMYFYYDTNHFTQIPNFSQNAWGRVTSVDYFSSSDYNCSLGAFTTGTRFTEMYNYTPGGLATAKRLYVTWNTSWNTNTINASNYLEALYTYDSEGKMVSVTYPKESPGGNVGRTYTYSFDSLGRPNKLTDNQPTPIDWVKDVLYGPAGQMTQMRFTQTPTLYYTETRTFNSRLQLTQINTTDYAGAQSFNRQDVFSATQNNGQITQSIDAVSGETVAYTYDSLTRLITAATTGPQWGLSFSYDGFGNRTSQSLTKGSGPTSSLSINAANNHITTTGYGYASNGNLTAMPGQTLSYDIENRLVQYTGSSGTELYAYAPNNRRVYKKLSNGSEQYFFYGVNGDLLKTYSTTFQEFKSYSYFAGRRVQVFGPGTEVQFLDRLGSVRTNSTNSRYYPYREEVVATTNDTDKFATYYRDSTTALDYAQNRYYASTLERFTTPDPYGGSANLADPRSWNRYAYVSNDPVNRNDPTGLGECYLDAEGRIICYVSDVIFTNPDPPIGASGWYWAKAHPGGGARLGRPPDREAVKKFIDEAGVFLQRKDPLPDDCVTLLNTFLQPFNFTIDQLKTKMGGMLKHVADGTVSTEVVNGREVKSLFALRTRDGTDWLYDAVASMDKRNGVWIRPSVVRSNSEARNQALGIHETIHNLTNLGDEWMKGQLGLESFKSHHG